MRAIRMIEMGNREVLKLATIDKPTITSDDQILVKDVYAGLNIDTLAQRGNIPPTLPLVPGMEGVGIIEASGSKVADSYPVGAHVTYMAFGAKKFEYTKFSLAYASKAHEAMLACKTTGKVFIEIPQ